MLPRAWAKQLGYGRVVQDGLPASSTSVQPLTTSLGRLEHVAFPVKLVSAGCEECGCLFFITDHDICLCLTMTTLTD